MTEDMISRRKVEEVIAALDAHGRDMSRDIDDRIRREQYSAPESYLEDMRGYSRGIYHMKEEAVKFLKKNLLETS